MAGKRRASQIHPAMIAVMAMSQQAACGPIRTQSVRKVIADTTSRSLLLRILFGTGPVGLMIAMAVMTACT